LELECHKLVSTFAFNFNLRHYIEEFVQLIKPEQDMAANEVGRCRLTVSKSMLKAPMVSVSALETWLQSGGIEICFLLQHAALARGGVATGDDQSPAP
jgi:hypothetical protein